MKDGHATYDELRNAPAGRAIRERRYSTLGGFRVDGLPVRTEHRATAARRARVLAAEYRARLDTLKFGLLR